MHSPPTTTVGWSPGLTNVENQVKALMQAAEANIARLTAQIRELNSMREKERSVLATLRLMIVPIGKLPTELLVEIFRLAVHTPVLSEHVLEAPVYSSRPLYYGDLRTGLRKALCLSQVSPYWRQIVHDAPQLWAEGVVGVHLGGKQGSLPRDIYLEGLKTLLSRSSPYPISIDLRITSTDDSIVRIMAPTVKRWKNLNLALGSLGQLNGIPRRSGAFQFEALERLHIRLSSQTSAITEFQAAPRLRSFALETADEPRIHLFQLPWSQLTHLDVFDYSLGGCRNALLQCSSLISARFYTSCDWDLTAEAANAPMALLPFLTTLNLGVEGDNSGSVDGLEVFFAPLALPALTTLDLIFDSNYTESWPIETFSAFQDRAPKLEKIALSYSSLDSDALEALLRHAPALETLDVQCSRDCVDDGLLEALRYDEADPAPPLAPKLQNIEFFCVDEFDGDLLEAAIRSRWWADGRVLADGSPPRTSRLRKVLFKCDDCGAKNDEFKTRTEDLVQQGLVLDVEV
ncbi:hypothetical protein DFH06DRAFT_729228 [Mycena polygramma]|nr:hypothetical protein DFH06DRAFT_729228 [Mycena polygramma]